MYNSPQYAKNLLYQRTWFIYMLTGQADIHIDKQTNKMTDKKDI